MAERIGRIAATDRWIPPSLDLAAAVENSRLNQTLNTPALATLFLADWQVRWLNEQGGLDWAAKRCDTSAEAIYRLSLQARGQLPTKVRQLRAPNGRVTGTVEEYDSHAALEKLARLRGLYEAGGSTPSRLLIVSHPDVALARMDGRDTQPDLRTEP